MLFFESWKDIYARLRKELILQLCYTIVEFHQALDDVTKKYEKFIRHFIKH